MISEYLATVQDFMSGGFFTVYLMLISAISIFLFWRSIQRTSAKDESLGEMNSDERLRWCHKVFDLLVISLVTAVIFARLAYIISRPGEFGDARWFWIPYERIDGEVFLFTSLPWLVFRFWDNGILIEGLILGWMVSIVLFSRMMKVKWGTISNAVADLFWFLFVAIEMYLAIRWERWWLMGIVVYFLILGFVRWRSNRQKAKKGPSFGQRVVSVLWKVSVLIGIPALLLINNVFFVDVPHRGVLIILSAVAVLVGVWILAGDLLEFFSILQTDVPKMFTKEAPELRVEPQKGSEIVSAGTPEAQGWRRFTTATPVAKKSVGAEVQSGPKGQRNFSRSYKHFTSGWKNTVAVLFARLTRSKSGGSDETDRYQ